MDSTLIGVLIGSSSAEAKDFLDSWEKDYQESYEDALKESLKPHKKSQ